MEFAEFNGAGGALLKLNESEFLLGTGVPVKARANSEIYKDAQNDKSYWGKILKLDFSSGNLKISIFSKGFRNPQGITKLDGNLYAVEHGPHGGDEINLIVEGGNYGWPIQSFGSEYDFSKIEKYYTGIKNNKLPLYTFMPSIGISDVSQCPINYDSYYHPFSCLAVSSLRDGSIYFLVFDKNKVFFTERMNFNYRIRKLFVSNDKIFGVTDYAGVITGRLSELH
jgi:glucose/arabinose dehydrogenase